MFRSLGIYFRDNIAKLQSRSRVEIISAVGLSSPMAILVYDSCFVPLLELCLFCAKSKSKFIYASISAVIIILII